MSRIRGIEAKGQKDVLLIRKNGLENNKNKEDRSSDETDKQQIKELVSKLPELQDIFHVHRKIGVGTFSSVYLGSLRQHQGLRDNEKRWFAIKHLVPNTHPARVEHELRCLQEMGGKDNIIGVELCLRHVDTIVFVMPYIPHRKFSEYVSSMDGAEVREYVRALLVALRRVHSFNVIHRDVKPSNFLYDRDNKRYLLVDFGLAQHISPPEEEPAPPRPALPRPALSQSNVHEPPPAHANSHVRKRLREFEELSPAAKRAALDLTVGPKHRDVDVTKAKQLDVPNVSNIQVAKSKHLQVPTSETTTKPAVCACWGVGGVCGVCAGRAGARACRAGTGGFRPPEVLLKYPHQGTAVDMWAAGVVLASALCARYPFFRATDDASALAELGDMLGTDALQRVADRLGRRLLTSRTRPGLCLRKLCARLRSAPRPAIPAPVSASRCNYCKLSIQQCLCRDPDKPADSYTRGARVAGFPDSAFALAARLLDPDPHTRISADEALRHPFFTDTL